MKKTHFLIFAFDHPNDAVVSVGKWMAGGLKALGFDVEVLSIPRDIQKLSELLKEDICGIISLGPMSLDIKVDNKYYLWQVLKCPFWLYMLDAIIYDYYRVPLMREYLHDAMNEDRLSLVTPEEGYIKLLGLKTEAGVLPHNSKYIPFGHFANLNSNSFPKEKRLCVIGAIGNELGLTQNINDLKELFSFYGEIILSKNEQVKILELFLNHEIPNMPVQLLMQTLNWSAEDILVNENLPLICAVDSYYKRIRRINVIKSLSGYPVDFYGSGWHSYFPDEPKFRFLGNIKHQEIALYSARYKAIINFDPNWECGVHDRVYTSTAMGTPVITNCNLALETSQIPSHLIYTYNVNEPRLNEIADDLISKNNESNILSLENLSINSWVNRMAQLILI